MIPSVQTTMERWSLDHPRTRVLKKSEEIRSSGYESYFQDPERTGLFRTVWLRERLPGKTMIHGLQLGPHALAVTDEVLSPGAKVEAVVGDVPVVLERESDGGVRARRMDTGEGLVVRAAYWFAWSTYFPRTEVIDQED